jgi:lipid-A-disaccharide synthase
MLKVFIVAGEASGDRIGAKLMDAMLSITDDIRFYGVGGSNMISRGFRSLFNMHELSIMGFAEILPKAFSLKARITHTARAVEHIQPDVVITIDSPGFNLRLAKKLNKLREAGKLQAKLIHYVAPTVWAYKPERALKFEANFDKLLCILPFEQQYFHKLETHFVGHPVIEDTPPEKNTFRKHFRIKETTDIIAMMPGSRKMEIKRMLPIFLDAMKLVSQKNPDTAIVILTLDEYTDYIRRKTARFKLPVYIVAEQEYKEMAIASSRLVLTKSGTSSMEVANMGVMPVVAYKISKISYAIIKKMAKIKFVNLINIMQGKMIIPELIQGNCTPAMIARTITLLLDDEAKIGRILDKCNEVFEALGRNDETSPSEKAARIILSLDASA